MIGKKYHTSITCGAEDLRRVNQWLDQRTSQCYGEIIKYDCQENTVMLTLSFTSKASLMEFQLTFR